MSANKPLLGGKESKKRDNALRNIMSELDDECDNDTYSTDESNDDDGNRQIMPGMHVSNVALEELLTRAIEAPSIDVKKMPGDLRHKYAMKLPLGEFLNISNAYPDDFSETDIRYKKCEGNWKIAVTNGWVDVYQLFEDGETCIDIDLALYLALSFNNIELFKYIFSQTKVTDSLAIIRLLNAAANYGEDMIVEVMLNCAIEMNGFICNVMQNWVRRQWIKPITTLQKMLPPTQFAAASSVILIQTCAHYGQLETLKLITNNGATLQKQNEEHMLNIMRSAVESNNIEVYKFIAANIMPNASHSLLERICMDTVQLKVLESPTADKK
jgi:hypothetical protein